MLYFIIVYNKCARLASDEVDQTSHMKLISITLALWWPASKRPMATHTLDEFKCFHISSENLKPGRPEKLLVVECRLHTSYEAWPVLCGGSWNKPVAPWQKSRSFEAKSVARGRCVQVVSLSAKTPCSRSPAMKRSHETFKSHHFRPRTTNEKPVG